MKIEQFSTTSTTQRRSLIGLCAGVSFMHMAMVDASAVATLLFAERVGPTWSGMPPTAGVLGTAVGTIALSRMMAGRGRRAGLLAGYGVAAIGGVLAIIGVASDTIVLLVGAMALLGFGNGAAQLSRYAAAEMYPIDRRGFGLSAVVWAGTIGAVAGPALIAPAARLGGGDSFGGVFLLVMAVVVGAWAASASLPRRLARALPEGHKWAGVMGAGALGEAARVRLALAAMVTGQVVMAAVMTMTPLYMHDHGHGLAAVGSVLSAHTLGMFALSPISGRITDRFGSRVAIGSGLSIMAAAAVIAIAAPSDGGAVLPAALFLLGFGWNLGHVGGSSLLSHGLETTDRMRVQGSVDGVVWGAAALATLSSGAIFGIGGYTLLGIVAGSLLIYPALVLRRAGNQLATEPL
jgi:MFS family permease